MIPALRRALMELSISDARRICEEVYPSMPLPKEDEAVLMAMHQLRTAHDVIPARQRYYSHRWLLDHGFASRLPDRLKAPAERMYPKVIHTVLFAPAGKAGPEATGLITAAVNDAILDCEANGDLLTPWTKIQMMRARHRERNGLMLKKLHLGEEVPMAWRP